MTDRSVLISRCLESIRAAGMKYAVLHGVERLPGDVISDIDIVVAAEDLERLGPTLRSFAEDSGGMLVQRIKHESTAVYYVLALPCNGSRTFLKIDACSDYRRDGVVLFTTAELSDCIRDVNGFSAVDISTEYAYLFAKRALKLNRWDEETVRFFSQAARCDATRLRDAIGRVAPRRAEAVLKAFTSGDAEYFTRCSWELRTDVLRSARRRHRVGCLLYWPRELVRRAERTVRATGYHVALLGPDGVGKTLLAENLITGTADAFRSTALLHLRPALLPARAQEGEGRSVLPYTRKPLGRLMSVFKLAYLWMDYVLGYWTRVYPAKIRSTLIVYDRYFADILADPARYRYAGPRRLAQIAHRMSCAPDLYIVLSARPETIQSRKSEMPLAQTAQLASAYSRIASVLPGAVETVSAEAPDDVVASMVCDLVLKRMSSKVDSWIS